MIVSDEDLKLDDILSYKRPEKKKDMEIKVEERL